MDILIGVIASLIAAIIIFVFKHWTGDFFSDFKARVASSIENGNNGSNRDNITENILMNISPLLMKINCSRCNTINPLANNDCSNCGNKDIARQKIVDRGFYKSIILSVISVIIFPLNLLFGILSLLIILKAYIYSNIVGFFIPIIVLGKVFSFFEKTPWSHVGLASVGFLISGIIIATLEYAIENENSIPQKLLRFMLMFLFPPLFILIYLNYYEPRSVLESISMEVKKNLNETVSEDDAKKIFTDQPTMNLFEASYHMRKKNYLKSKKILLENQFIDKLINQEDNLIKYHDLLAKNLDFLDESNSAFDHFNLRNNIKSNQLHNKIYDKNIILDLIQNYKKYFIKINLDKFTKPVIPKKYQTPIFLVGFPRSGTTLLDSILRSHSKILVLEEKLIISSIRDRFFEKNNNKINSLELLSDDDILSLQSEYFDMLHEIMNEDIHNKIIIDKLPLNLIEVGFIKRVFPQSKFILMLRHPCDTVLSCFMSDFKINEGMASFYNLKDATILYNEVFSLWDQYLEVYDLAYHIVKYEEVVLNFDNTIKKTINFLNVEWEEDVKNFNATALARKKINTPSYNQVVQPLYEKSINRWKKYDEIKKIYSSLEHWIKKYNYN